MSVRRRVGIIVLAGVVAGLVARFVDASGVTGALSFLAAGIVLGELLVLRLEDGSAIPLGYAVLVVLAASFSAPEYALAVLGAELISIVLSITDRSSSWRLGVLIERLIVAASTFAAYRLAANAIHHGETVAAALVTLAAAVAAQVVVDATLRKVLHLGASFSTRGRLAWLAIASSGMLMAIGYRGVGGHGEVGIWGPLLFSTPLLAAWYAFERLDSATRAYRQTIEALAMAPEFGGLVGPGHSERVAVLAVAMAELLRLPGADVNDLEMAARLHHLGQVTFDDPADPGRRVESADIAAVTSAMLREIRPLAGAGDIVAGDAEAPRRRVAVQILRLASAYDDLTAGDHMPSDVAIETLRSAPAYVYDGRVVDALERVLDERQLVSC